MAEFWSSPTALRLVSIFFTVVSRPLNTLLSSPIYYIRMTFTHLVGMPLSHALVQGSKILKKSDLNPNLTFGFWFHL